jgi:hypothetical protein
MKKLSEFFQDAALESQTLCRVVGGSGGSQQDGGSTPTQYDDPSCDNGCRTDVSQKILDDNGTLYMTCLHKNPC